MKLQIIAYALGLAGLAGCNTTAPATHGVYGLAPPPDAAPGQGATLAPPDAEKLYAIARRAHAAGRTRMAAQDYERLLSLNPVHVGALNALGVIRSQERRTADALALFARALALEPNAAHIHNNMGYTLLREERLEEAGRALRRALALRPNSPQTQHNLELLAQAVVMRDNTLAAAVQPAAPAAMLVAVAPRVYELRTSQPQASVPAAALAHQQLGASQSLHDQRVEVSNGVGTKRLAWRTARRLADLGLPPAHLTDARPFRQKRTQIEYLPGQQAAVQALAVRLPVPVEQVPVSRLNAAVHMRLVLGHDTAGRAISAWAEGPRPSYLALQSPGKDLGR